MLLKRKRKVMESEKKGGISPDMKGEFFPDKKTEASSEKEDESSIEKNGETSLDKKGEISHDKKGETYLDKKGEISHDKKSEISEDGGEIEELVEVSKVEPTGEDAGEEAADETKTIDEAKTDDETETFEEIENLEKGSKDGNKGLASEAESIASATGNMTKEAENIVSETGNMASEAESKVSETENKVSETGNIAEEAESDDDDSQEPEPMSKFRGVAEAFAKGRGLSGDELEDGLMQIKAIGEGWRSGELTTDMLDLVLKGLSYDRDMERAVSEAELRGRNAAIDEGFMQEPISDGLPHLGSGGSVGNGGRMNSIFDLAREAGY